MLDESYVFPKVPESCGRQVYRKSYLAAIVRVAHTLPFTTQAGINNAIEWYRQLDWLWPLAVK